MIEDKLKEFYLNNRKCGMSTIESYDAAKHLIQLTSFIKCMTVEDSEFSTFINMLMHATIGAMLYGMLFNLYQEPKLWIKSPNGKVVKEFEAFTAMRIVRKHTWRYCNTAPNKNDSILSRSKLTRFESIKYLITGKALYGC